MPYLISSIMAVVAAMIILLTRYESDDSAITSEIERTKSMFLAIDGFVNTYIQSGGDMTSINFESLYDDGILLGNIKMTKPAAATNDNIKGTQNESVLIFPRSEIKWQLIPIPTTDTEYASSAGSGYKILVNLSGNSTLNSKAIFAESFISREYCEKTLFGTADRKGNEYDKSEVIKNFKSAGKENDGKFVCTVFK